TGFILPNGAVRSPDLSWIVKERIARFSQEEKARFLPLTPDFILELMSPSDLLEIVQDKMTSDPLKGSTVPTTEETSATDCLTAPSYGARERARMQEYQDNGVKLGWLINPQRQQVAVYRPQQVTEIMDSPATLSGEAVLPDLVVELDFIWR
ncbi:MAG: Uma2 family endonuclease, partial [Cyanobacteria bacterium J06558_2]